MAANQPNNLNGSKERDGQSTRRPLSPEEEAYRRRMMAQKKAQGAPVGKTMSKSVLTPEEQKILRQKALEARQKKEAEEKERKAQKKQKRQEALSKIVAVIMVVCGLVVVGCAGYFALVFFSQRENSNTANASFHLSSPTQCFDEVPYVNLSELASKLEWVIVGDAGEIRFILTKQHTGDEENQEIRVIANESYVLINNQKVVMIAPCYVIQSEYWVPFDLINAHVYGLTVSEDKSIYPFVERKKEKNSDGVEAFAFLDLSVERLISWPDDGNITTTTQEHTTKPITEPETSEPITTEPREDPIQKIVDSVTFSQNLTLYEKYMNPTGEQRDAFLTLVNKEKTVTSDLIPSPLVSLNTKYTYNGRSVQLVETAAKALEALYLEMYAAGYKDMHITSGYRSYEEQLRLYNVYVSNEIAKAKSKGQILSQSEAQAIVDTYSARAGTSEHQTALCIDMHNLSSADVKFANEKAYQWLLENAWKFGFVLRFPEDKTDITGYSFEPWHWRFVGRYHAYQIWSQELCLEEYLAQK